ncbi:TetR/AcrR family transcriptional regulator [Lentzea sp. NPDC042327]|uniref:TetR/AcrR family transcriptional regulator n=1 Tax=Lentzea sp. NPDC042327 TaxID=3154801 RepID=UPI0033DFF488
MPRPRKFDESAVLAAARDQFWSAGYAGTTMDAVAAATDLGKGSLYGAFGGKQELFHRVFDDYCAQAEDGVRRELTGPDEEAFARLTAHVHGIAASVAADTAHRGCLLAKGTAELAEHDPVVAARALRTFDELERLLVADIEACQRHGDLSPGADPHRLAALVLTVLRGMEALGKAGKDARFLEAVAESALAALPRP